MTPLATAALAIALDTCHLPDTLARLAAGIMLRENPKLDPRAINHNANGTDDRGYTQVNDVNYGWLSKAMGRPINRQTIMEPCTNLQAGVMVEFVRYNGHPPETVAAAYAVRAWNAAVDIDSAPTAPAPPPSPPPCAPAWDAWALATCSRHQAPATTLKADPHAN